MDIFQKMKDHRISSIEIMPVLNDAFYTLDINGNSKSISLPTDGIIGKTTFENNCWDREKINFFHLHSQRYDKIVLVDVGANVGLFSRQCVSAMNNIQMIFAYEPQRVNFSLLQRNLTDIQVKTLIVNAALSNKDEETILFEDQRNCGNYSLNKGAMWDHPEYKTSTVKVIDALSEQLKWTEIDKPIFYKSDTQGFDELIATTYDTDFWSKVECASFELWRVNKPELNTDKFIQMLNQFPNKSFQYENRNSLTNEDVLNYISGTDGNHEDLLCWK